MMHARTVITFSSLAVALICGAAQAQPAAQSGKPMITLQMPATPEPARVTLDPKTTSLIMLDYVEDICAIQPSCKNQMLPAMVPFMERIRKAGLRIVSEQGEVDAHLQLESTSPAAVAREALEDQIALADLLLKQQFNWFFAVNRAA